MKIKVENLWDSVRASYWFVPALMTIAAMLLSVITVSIDSAWQETWNDRTGENGLGSAEAARALLSTVAASLITVAGVVFSVVIVALTLASSQFGPRLLRTFLSDASDQTAFGTLVGSFAYCLLVLRNVRGEHGGQAFVPHISVGVGVLLTLASLGMLIYFIHHVAVSLQASSVIASVGRDLDHTIDRLFPSRKDDASGEGASGEDGLDAPPPIPDFQQHGERVETSRTGYLQAIDYDQLRHVATEHGVVIRVEREPGEYVEPGAPVATVCPAPADREEFGRLSSRTADAFVVGSERMHGQDVQFPIQQLVQLALRALSPAINDPITAIMVVERLGGALCRLAQRRLPERLLADDQGHLRLIVNFAGFDQITDSAFDQLRQYTRTNVNATCALLDALTLIARRARDEDLRAALLRQATMIERGSHAGLPEEWDRDRVAERFQAFVDVLNCRC